MPPRQAHWVRAISGHRDYGMLTISLRVGYLHRRFAPTQKGSLAIELLMAISRQERQAENMRLSNTGGMDTIQCLGLLVHQAQ